MRGSCSRAVVSSAGAVRNWANCWASCWRCSVVESIEAWLSVLTCFPMLAPPSCSVAGAAVEGDCAGGEREAVAPEG